MIEKADKVENLAQRGSKLCSQLGRQLGRHDDAQERDLRIPFLFNFFLEVLLHYNVSLKVEHRVCRCSRIAQAGLVDRNNYLLR